MHVNTYALALIGVRSSGIESLMILITGLQASAHRIRALCLRFKHQFHALSGARHQAGWQQSLGILFVDDLFPT